MSKKNTRVALAVTNTKISVVNAAVLADDATDRLAKDSVRVGIVAGFGYLIYINPIVTLTAFVAVKITSRIAARVGVRSLHGLEADAERIRDSIQRRKNPRPEDVNPELAGAAG